MSESIFKYKSSEGFDFRTHRGFLQTLIRSCELNSLNEKQSIKVLYTLLQKKISREPIIIIRENYIKMKDFKH